MNQLDRWADFLIANAISENPSTETDLLWYIENDPDTGKFAAEILPSFRALHSSPEYSSITEKMQAYKSDKDRLYSLSGTEFHLADINLSHDKACIRERIVTVISDMNHTGATEPEPTPDALIVTHDNAVERCPECGSGDLIGEYETDADGNVIVNVAYCRCGWFRNVRR